MLNRHHFKKTLQATPANTGAVSILRQALLLCDTPHMPYKVVSDTTVEQIDMDICSFRLGLLPFYAIASTDCNELNVTIKNDTREVRPVLSVELKDQNYECGLQDQVLFYLSPGSQLNLKLLLAQHDYTKSYKYSLAETPAVKISEQEDGKKLLNIEFYYYDRNSNFLEKLLERMLEEKTNLEKALERQLQKL